jgi:hypothetical protein
LRDSPCPGHMLPSSVYQPSLATFMPCGVKHVTVAAAVVVVAARGRVWRLQQPSGRRQAGETAAASRRAHSGWWQRLLLVCVGAHYLLHS